MTADLDIIRTYFAKLDLEPEIGSLYLALCLYGPQTIAGLARHSGVERTRIYRLQEAMEKSGLFSISLDNKRKIYAAAPVGNLQVLLSKREEELHHLEMELDNIHKILDEASLQTPLTHVQFYKGVDGMKQLFWNQTRAEGEVLCVLRENMQNRVGRSYFNRWVRKCNEKGLRYRGIVSADFQSDQKSWYAKHRNERLQHWEQRQIPTALLSIDHSTITHDDRVIYYNWGEREIYGIEIFNTEIARSQKRFFELLWQQATPAKDVDVPKGLDGLRYDPPKSP